MANKNTNKTTKKKNTNTKYKTNMSHKKTNEKINNNKKIEKKEIEKKKNNIIDNLLNDKVYKEAEKLYKNKEYKDAEEKYLILLDKYKKNKKIYKRLIECLTHDYTFKDNNKEFKNKYDDYVTTYRLLANKKELKFFEQRLEEYRSIRISTGKSKFLLIALLGWFGVHKFIEKKYIIGILYLITFGFFGIGVIVDLINDYAIYENDLQLDIFRYIISFLILLFAIFRHESENFYYFILVAIIFMPIIYSKLLKIIPSLIKLVLIVVLIYFGFKTTPVINYIPTGAVGNWITKNENTNLKELDIKLEQSTIKFNDRDDQVGINEYDNQNHILKIEVDDNTYYKFRLYLNENKICVYTESEKCIVEFEKNK